MKIPAIWEEVPLDGLGYPAGSMAVVRINPTRDQIATLDALDELLKDQGQWSKARVAAANDVVKSIQIDGEAVAVEEAEDGDQRIMSLLLSEVLERRSAALGEARAAFRRQRFADVIALQEATGVSKEPAGHVEGAETTGKPDPVDSERVARQYNLQRSADAE